MNPRTGVASRRAPAITSRSTGARDGLCWAPYGRPEAPGNCAAHGRPGQSARSSSLSAGTKMHRAARYLDGTGAPLVRHGKSWRAADAAPLLIRGCTFKSYGTTDPPTHHQAV
jgi:hypothetical protein